MVKRVVVVALWFVSTWFTYGLIAYFVGVPHSGGAIVGALIAALVWMDPMGSLWAAERRHQPTSAEDPSTERSAVVSR